MILPAMWFGYQHFGSTARRSAAGSSGWSKSIRSGLLQELTFICRLIQPAVLWGMRLRNPPDLVRQG